MPKGRKPRQPRSCAANLRGCSEDRPGVLGYASPADNKRQASTDQNLRTNFCDRSSSADTLAGDGTSMRRHNNAIRPKQIGRVAGSGWPNLAVVGKAEPRHDL